MPETIGQRLKRAREYRHLTLEKAADATRIRLQYLQALEADDFSAMPSPVQARGFLRNYADYLGLDLTQMVEELRSAAPQPLPTQEVVFEGETASPAAAEEPGQAPAPEESPLQPGSEGDSLASSARGWLERLLRIQKAQDKQPVETLLPDENPDERIPVEEEQPAPRKSRRKKAPSAPEPAPQSASGPGPGPAPSSDAVPLAPAGTLPQEPPVAEVAPKAPTVPVWKSALAWALSLRGIWQRLPRRAQALEAEAEPRVPEAGQEGLEAGIPSPDASQPVESSQEIFNAIGSQLRQRREILSLAHDEIERHTRMRAQFLAALEDGRIDDLPSPVQTRGMLSNYATFLDLDADALLLRFADALQAQHRERHPARPAKSPQGEQSRREKPAGVIPESLPRWRMFIAGDLVFGIGMIVLLVVFAIWGISRVVSVRSQQAEAEETAPSISEALLGTPVETVEAEATPIPVEDTPLPAPLEGTLEGTLEVPTLAGNVNVQVNIVAIERSYLRVVVDGEVAFDGRTTPGTVYPFEAEASIEVLAGNASALRIIYNQRDLGLLGGFGQLVNYVYTADEIVVPTPAASPSPTLTPFDTPTPPATPTPSPSPTIAPSGDTL
ncbi:MAG: RodZ domain-containing protein, partial [Chloroflexota bacterium]